MDYFVFWLVVGECVVGELLLNRSSHEFIAFFTSVLLGSLLLLHWLWLLLFLYHCEAVVLHIHFQSLIK